VSEVKSANSYDVIVIGQGGMGSAAAYHLARRGRRVLGIERYSVGHDLGSSHGVNRIIRRPYYEHERYVPLVSRAYELWRDLEAACGETLLHITGGVDIGRPDSQTIAGVLAACRRYDLPHELLGAASLAERFPAFRLPPDFCAVYQHDGGFVLSEASILAHVRLARAHGADIHEHETVLEWSVDAGRARVATDRGVYEAEQLVIAAGAWIADLVPALKGLAVPERQVLGWFAPSAPEFFRIGRFPVFTMTVDEGDFFGFPEFGRPGFKFAKHHHLGETATPSTMRRSVDAADEAALRSALERYFPDGAGPALQLSTCLYTNTQDEHFIIDRHPDHREALLLSPCSGHGYKFCSVIGEIVADLIIEGETRHDIGLFRFDRPGNRRATAEADFPREGI
jgi:sarcosine oxidase